MASRNSKLRQARATVVSGNMEVADSTGLVKAYKQYSKQMTDEDSAFGGGTGIAIVEPPFSPSSLLRLPKQNNVLDQCIQAMVTNVDGFGHRLEYVGPDGGETSRDAVAEKSRMKAILDSPNSEISFLELRKRFRTDRETVGWGAIEVLRGTDGGISALFHVESHTIRVTQYDKDPIDVDSYLIRDGKTVLVTSERRFRRYVQVVGGRKVYFKEFGDPRPISSSTGRVTDEAGDIANELLYDPIYSTGHAYGIPRYMNQLPSILGSREAELTNLVFFQDNAIPALAILVSGGVLTSESMETVKREFSDSRGRESMQKVLVLEAQNPNEDERAEAGIGAPQPPRIDIKPLSGARQGDELFGKYDESCQKKIRGAFRIPPIFVGRSDDYTRATAQTSLDIAESQVFSPERNAFDDIVNFRMLLDKEGKPPIFWRFRSNPAKIVGHGDIITTLGGMEKLGAMTPNIAIGMTNEMFNMHIPLVSENWGNMPFTLVTSLVQRYAINTEKVPFIVQELLDSVGAAQTSKKFDSAKVRTRRRPAPAKHT